MAVGAIPPSLFFEQRQTIAATLSRLFRELPCIEHPETRTPKIERRLTRTSIRRQPDPERPVTAEDI